MSIYTGISVVKWRCHGRYSRMVWWIFCQPPIGNLWRKAHYGSAIGRNCVSIWRNFGLPPLIALIGIQLGVELSQAKSSFTRLELGLSWIRKTWAWLIIYHRLCLKARLDLHKSLAWPTSLSKSLLKDVFDQLIVLKPNEILTKKRNL